MFRPASAVDCYLSSLRAGDCGLPLRRRVPARVLMVACLPPPSGVADGSVSCTLDSLYIDRNYFRSLLASSSLSFVWVFGGLVQVFSCLALLVPVGVRSGFAPADFSSLWFCLVERI